VVASDPAAAQEQRERHAGSLADNPCVGDYQGQIIPRNTCRQPSFNRLDVRFNREFSTVRGQRLGLEVDLFNVLNGLNSEWGQYVSVSAARRNLINPSRFNQETGQIEYTVPTGFGNRTTLGANLLLQFQAQVGLRYRF